MSNPTTSPTRAELLAKIEAGRASIAALRDDTRTLGQMPTMVRDMHVTLLHRLLDALAAAPSPGDALRQQIEALPRWDDVQCFPDDPAAPPYAEMRRDGNGRFLALSDVLALLSRGEAGNGR